MSSLLPYLKSAGTKFCLNFPVFSQDASTTHGKSRFPFMVIDDSDPLARVIEARLTTDAGSEIKRVFVLLQKDEYQLPSDGLRPLSNMDIDQSWKRTFSHYSYNEGGASIVVLGDQVNQTGNLLSLRSLFFCKERQTFFHPPCPLCGTHLDLCYDDDLLVKCGLQPYSTSLRRYMFCHSCFSSTDKPDFYVFSLESSDPQMLKDRWDMIREFSLLTKDRNYQDEFPCIACSQYEECYGADGMALSRIIPFSFYPFYMLVFDSMSVKALDFLALISGAALDDLVKRLDERGNTGRTRCLKVLDRGGAIRKPFLFDGSERNFLEVLYLKLSFLGEVTQKIFSALEHGKYPDSGFSVDRIWVKLNGQGSLLPFFWNFQVEFIEVEGSVVKTLLLPELPPSSGFYFLGLVWFHTLLVNGTQDISDVCAVLGKEIEGEASNSGAREAFLPENIFWDPKGKTIGDSWRSVWENSLSLGWSLLRAGLSRESDLSENEFLQELETLREEIREGMFQPEPTIEKTGPAIEDEAIHEILVNIGSKWHVDDPSKEEDLEETVVVKGKTIPELFPDTVTTEHDTEILEETVILPVRGKETSRVEDIVPEEVEEIEETIILSPRDKGKGTLPLQQAEDDDIPETVIISPSEKPGVLTETPPFAPEKDAVSVNKWADWEDKPEKDVESDSSKDPGDSDDFLAETVILKPGNLKKRGQDGDQ